MKKSLKNALVIVVVVLFSFLWHFAIRPEGLLKSQKKTGLLWSLEQSMEDLLYRRPVGTSKNIKIIGIDEETLDKYGKFEDRSRDRLAALLELLSTDAATVPRVIAMDFLLVSNSQGNAEEDIRLAEAAKHAGNVVLASNLVYRTAFGTDEEGNIYSDEWNISHVELPYEQLAIVTENGFADPFTDADGYIRRARVTTSQGKELFHSFAYQIYRKYLEVQDKQPEDFDNIIQFQYSGASGDYEKVSLLEVLEGRVDIRAFKNCIVLIGAYAPGMQDSFHVAVDHGEQMYGVEVHANIADALINHKIVRDIPAVVACVAATLLLAGYAFVALRQKKLMYI